MSVLVTTVVDVPSKLEVELSLVVASFKLVVDEVNSSVVSISTEVSVVVKEVDEVVSSVVLIVTALGLAEGISVTGTKVEGATDGSVLTTTETEDGASEGEADGALEVVEETTASVELVITLGL